MNMFTGLSAFPLTPLHNDQIDESAFARIIQRLRDDRVDSITALGSTGSYVYLTAEERANVAQLAVKHAGDVPVFVGVGALRTSQVLSNIESAEAAGAAAVLLAPVSYQRLGEDEVFELFCTVTEHTELPVIVYDNPSTTQFTFTNALYGRIAALPGIASIKIPGVPTDPQDARAHVTRIQSVIPDHVTIGVSGDVHAVTGMNAGCEAWYSVIGGTLAKPALNIVRAVQENRPRDAVSESERLTPLWNLFAEFGGSLRVVAAIAEQLGLAPVHSLPLPLQGLTAGQRDRVTEVLNSLELE